MKELRFLKLSIIVAILFSILVLSGCITTTTTKVLYPESLPPLMYSFDYTPAEKLPYSDITIAIVNPIYEKKEIKNCDSKEVEKIVEDYLAALKNDFEEVVIDKGYKITGPFNTLQDMTYGEREKSILALEPKVFLSVTFNDEKKEIYSEAPKKFPTHDKIQTQKVTAFADGYEKVIKISGTLVATVSISFALWEPLTREKMLIRQISIPIGESINYHYFISTIWKGYRTIEEILLGGWVVAPEVIESKPIEEADYRPRALAKALESIYTQQLEQFSRYFDPKEIAQVKLDAEKVRKLKRY